mmetsp:Transcript_8292/g.15086  ORF Transcript_8292/g.15086 Transcript_8292/m.15086 type:complete len:241 (+) Transcript_8292:63-785(+)
MARLVSSLLESPWLSWLPLLLFFLVLLLATVFPEVESITGLYLFYCGPYESCQRPIHRDALQPGGLLTWVADGVNVIIAGYGPLLPYMLLFVQCLDATVEETIFEMPVLVCFCLWMLMTVVRIVVFIYVQPYHYYFSDHIFLLNSILAQLQMSMLMTCKRHENEPEEENAWMIVELAVAFAILVLCLFEGFITSLLYHTLEASWMAFVVSTIIFQGAFLLWKHSEWNKPPSDKRALLVNQ